jgi:exodeoxyribonuclease III
MIVDEPANVCAWCWRRAVQLSAALKPRRVRRVQIATWNINSVRIRLPQLLRYLRDVAPDVLCLQEIKCTEDQFPRLEVEGEGYNIAIHGQKGFNGVAILAKRPMEAAPGLAGNEEDVQSRYIEALVVTDTAPLRVCCLYLPNGNPAGTEKYDYKLAWMDRLHARARVLLAREERLILAGDYNVIPEPRDVYEPQGWLNDALYLPQTRSRYRALLNLGLIDALRATSDEAGIYTFWDYQAGAWQRNKGIRIDHLLLSPQAADRLRSVVVDKALRDEAKPSDHVPVRIDLDV